MAAVNDFRLFKKIRPKVLPCKTPSARGQLRCIHETITNVFAVIFSSYGLMFSLSYLFMVEALTWMFMFLGWNRVRHVSCMQWLFSGCNVFALERIFYVWSIAARIGTTRCLDATSWHWHFIDNRRLMSLLAFPIPSSQLHPRYSHE